MGGGVVAYERKTTARCTLPARELADDEGTEICMRALRSVPAGRRTRVPAKVSAGRSFEGKVKSRNLRLVGLAFQHFLKARDALVITQKGPKHTPSHVKSLMESLRYGFYHFNTVAMTVEKSCN